MARIVGLVVFLYILVVLPKPSALMRAPGDEICPPTSSAHPHNIFAADNLANGTIRLYGSIEYWNLELFSYPTVDPSTTNWFSRTWDNVFTSKPAFFLDDGDIRLVARLDDTSPRSNLISDAYQGLSHSLTDQKWLSHVLVSFIDKQDIERTFLFETTDAPSANSTVPLHNGIWNTASGAYQEAFSVDKSLSAAFRVYLNDSQAMFFISKGKLYRGQDLKLKKNRAIVNIQLLFAKDLVRGQIPHPLTGAFAIQASSDRLWIILIICHNYCVVPWNAPGQFFDFTQCASSLKPLDAFFTSHAPDGIEYEKLAPFQAFTGKKLEYEEKTSASTDTATSGLTAGSSPSASSTFSTSNANSTQAISLSSSTDNAGNSDGTIWGLFTYLSLCLAILLLFSLSAFSFYHAYRKSRGNSYNLAKSEAKAAKEAGFKVEKDEDEEASMEDEEAVVLSMPEEEESKEDGQVMLAEPSSEELITLPEEEEEDTAPEESPPKEEVFV